MKHIFATVTPVRTPDFTLTIDKQSKPTAQGRDKAGRPWRINLPPATHSLWTSGAGPSRAFYFDGHTGGAGMAPGSWVLVISFDHSDRPSPFYITTYNPSDEQGIRDLLNLGAGSPLLLQQTWAYEKQNEAQQYGYYVTQAYRRKGPYWYKVTGSFGLLALPTFQRWEMMPAAKPQLVPKPDVPVDWNIDLGNDPAFGVQTRITALDKDGIRTGPELGCDVVSTIEVLVLDSPSGRTIDLRSQFQQIASPPLTATFTGLNRWPNSRNCAASIVWATSA